MKKTRILAAAMMSIGAAALPCAAAVSAGADPFAFLFLDAGARPVALGGAYTALASDANALLYNPAGLGRVVQDEATFMHNQYMQEISQDYAAIATRDGWSANFNRLGLGNIPRTTLANPDGEGSVSYSDLAVGAGYGRALTDSLSAGVGLKYVRESFDTVDMQGEAMDLGGLYSPTGVPGLSMGLAVQNIGPSVSGTSGKMPLNYRAGTAYAFHLGGTSHVLTADVSKERVQNAIAAVGVETLILEPMTLRAGYNSGNGLGSGVTVGVGFRFRSLSADYAFVGMGPAGDGHRISVTLRWGPAGLRKRIESAVSAAPAAALPAAAAASPAPVEAAPPSSPTVAAEPISTPTVVAVPPSASAAEIKAVNGLTAVAAPGSITPAVLKAVMGAAGDPSCPPDKDSVLCMNLGAEFESNKMEPEGAFAGRLHELATFLNSNPGARVAFQGHTDDSGTDDYNLDLSKRRAEAVKDYLSKREGIAPDVLTAEGMGKSLPVAPNRTAEDRRRNRRVIIVIQWPAGPAAPAAPAAKP
jgi:outer membrane protein OmpA-like peptidoglycan-associated protein